MSQCEAILEYLRKGNSLTPLEALDRFKTFRLAARVQDLKKQGYPITCRMVPTPTGKRVASYSLETPLERATIVFKPLSAHT
jgi:hypothetical protein